MAHRELGLGWFGFTATKLLPSSENGNKHSKIRKIMKSLSELQLGK